jgi:hypothetical protein
VGGVEKDSEERIKMPDVTNTHSMFFLDSMFITGIIMGLTLYAKKSPSK